MPFKKNEMKYRLSTFFTLSMIVLITPLHAQEKLVFSVVEGVSATAILQEGYKRIGIDIEAKILPAERALSMSNSGELDGEVNRIVNINMKYPNLIMIPIPIFFLDIVAFTKHLEFPVQSWESLAPYEVATLRGMKVAENGLQGMKYLALTEFEQILRMLDKERIEVAILPRLDGLQIIKKFNLKTIEILEPPLVRINLYHYLHKKHKHLVPKITASLRKMDKEGLIKKMFKQQISK